MSISITNIGYTNLQVKDKSLNKNSPSGWAGHLLRASEQYLPRRVAVAQLESDLQWGVCSGTAGIFQDAPYGLEVEELVEVAEDRM